MIYKKISLFLFAVLAIVLVFTIPFYNNWLNSKFGHEVDRMYDQTQHLAPEERMTARFGGTYMVQNAIINMFHSINAQNVVVLLPPANYIKDMRLNEAAFEVPEPAVFYYFTGYKAVTKNSAEVQRANWALLVQNHKMVMKHINSGQYRDSLLTLFKNY